MSCTPALAGSCSDSNQAIVTETAIDDQVAQVEWIRADPSDAAKTEALFVRSRSSALWRSVDEGKTFTKETIGPVRLIEPTADPKKVFFMGGEGQLWTTSDQGKTYKYYDTKLPFRYIDAHPTVADMALGLVSTKKCFDPTAPGVCKRDLYTTNDLGATWKLRREYVQQASWGAAGSDGVSVNNLLVITWNDPPQGVNQNRLSMYDMVFQRTRDLYVSIDYSVPHTAAFLFFGKTIFLAKLSGADVNADLSLYTSVNAGDTFNRAVFPKSEDLQENRYTILDLSENAAFINVDHSDDGSWGTTYGSNGGLETEFAEILRHTKRNPSGAVDFRRIKGLEGIYLANRYLTSAGSNPTAGSHVRTVGSWDKGGRWAKLKPPAVDSNQQPISCTGSCSLNLLGRTQSSLSQFYSTENAVGLILATGSVGPWLEDAVEDVNTYFSRDAGQSWAEIAKGSHVFEFGDHGAITILASNSKKTKSLHFSWDEGIEWTNCDFTDKEMDVSNIATEPSNTARNFILYGTRGDKGIIIHIDFTASPIRQFQPADYELWSPRGEACLLGEHYTYQRRKQATKCFVEKEFDRQSNRTVCACVEEDYECDFCFRPTNDNPPRCELACSDYDPQKPPIECFGQYPVSKGYRLVPGDKCDKTNSAVSRNLEPEMRACNGSTGDGDFASRHGGLSGGAIAGIVFLVLFVVFVGSLLVFLFLAKSNPRVAAALKKLPLPRSIDLFGRFDRPGGGGGRGGRSAGSSVGYARVGQQTDNGSLLADLQQENDDTLQDETVDLDSPKVGKDKDLIDTGDDDDDFNPRNLTTTPSSSSTSTGRGTESLV